MKFRALLILLSLLAPFSLPANEEPLRVEEAFRYETSADADAITVTWQVAEGYYLYRKRLGFVSVTDGIELGEPELPTGKIKEDEFFGKSEIYRGEMVARIPYTRSGAQNMLRLELKSQGCADFGLCYPPQRWETDIELPGGRAAPVTNLLAQLAADPSYGGNSQQFLPVDEAFRISAEVRDAYTLRVAWDIADGYYLYKDKLAFMTPGKFAQPGRPRLPAGKSKYDEFFGDVEVYYGRVEVDVPLSRAGPQAGEIELIAASQGCAEDGICYPPHKQSSFLMLPATDASAPLVELDEPATPLTEQDRIASRILGGNLLIAMGAMLLAGLGLAFTPCVLPMVPILSSIIAGQGEKLSHSRGFKLAVVYVLPMVLTYTIAGVIAAKFGQNLQAAFQNPAVIVGFSIVFVLLSLSMFGLYQIQIPVGLQNKLNQLSNRQEGGTYSGVAIMGVLSALIVGPCVAAPLAGALIVIGEHGDVVRGGLALFAMSLGMGLPLLAFGAGAGHMIPRAGAWMETVKVMFGFMLIGVAVWMLSRILPGPVTQALWALLAIATAAYLLATRSIHGGGRPPFGVRIAGITLAAYGAILGLSAIAGGHDPLAPLRGTQFGALEQHLEFKLIKTVADLDSEVAAASAAGRAAMLDFYADWCVSCKEMEKYTFTDPAVHEALGDAVLLQADVTANDDADQALLRYFRIIGPPTIAFFGPDGKERQGTRVVGFQKPDEFSAHLRAVLGDDQIVADGKP